MSPFAPRRYATGDELELSLKYKTGAGAMAIWEEAQAPGPFLDTNGFAKWTYFT